MLHYGLKLDIARGRKSADFVAKVFLGLRTKIFRAADASRTWRREGPHCFSEKRSRAFVSTLQCFPAVELSENQLTQDFRSSAIFDFCNKICQNQTCAQFGGLQAPL